MIRQFNLRVAFWILVVLIFISSITAMAAGNTVPVTKLGQQISAINANALKPSKCSALNLTNIVICPAAGGACNGTANNDLILGSAKVDNISGKGGADCIIGGGGNDTLNGNAGTDVCIGHTGDIYNSCSTIINTY
jgi:Ca2+-binding RTX toxin-like protein